MKRFLIMTLLGSAFVACQKEEVIVTPSTEQQTECAQSALNAKEALENKSDVAFDLSGSNQSIGCSTEVKESTFDL